MPQRPPQKKPPSKQPQKPPLNHKLIALVAFGGVCALGLGAIQFLGDPAAGGPRRIVELAPSTASAEAAPHVSFSDVAVEGDFQPLDAFETAPDGTLIPEEAEGELRVAVVDSAPTPPPRSPPLARAPISGLTEPGPNGQLPIIARDGRTPAQAYARPFTPRGSQPTIAIIVGGLG